MPGGIFLRYVGWREVEWLEGSFVGLLSWFEELASCAWVLWGEFVAASEDAG